MIIVRINYQYKYTICHLQTPDLRGLKARECEMTQSDNCNTNTSSAGSEGAKLLQKTQGNSQHPHWGRLYVILGIVMTWVTIETVAP